MLYLALLAPLVLATTQAPRFEVVQRIPIGGEGGWDCLRLDESGQRLFVSRATHVSVIDLKAGRVVGDIPGTNGVHDIAIVSKAGKGYVSDGRDNAVTVFSPKDLKEVKKIPVGNRPDVMAYDPATARLFVFNGGSQDATVIDTKTDGVVGTVKLGGKPEFAQADGRGTLYVNLEDKSEVLAVDTRSLRTLDSWPIKPGEEPSGLALDAKRGLVFSACGNGLLSVSDVRKKKAVAWPKIGQGPDGAAYDPQLGLVFVPNGQDGTMTILAQKAGTWEAVQTLQTQRSARTMALDTKTHRAYLIAAEFEKAAEGSRRPQMVPGSAVILVVGPAKP